MRKLNKSIWPYSVELPAKGLQDPFQSSIDPRKLWLQSHINAGLWYIVGVTKPTFYFKREKDMTWFLLNCS